MVQEAKNPLQLLARVWTVYDKNYEVMPNMPLTQDASASAYQIMNYFLLDEELAERTNLIPFPDNKIMDLYSF